MIIGTIIENHPETRVAISPQSAKNYIKLGFKILIEKEAGAAAGFSNKDYVDEGASLAESAITVFNSADILLCLNELPPDSIKNLKKHAILICHTEDTSKDSDLVKNCIKNQITLLSMTQIPRISRAQNMDSLSSQANLAGYKAVLAACGEFNRAIPMMMTAAGMIKPAKILVLGAGVAGLQAIATAKRLGAIVYAFDVRTAAKEQVESLGAEFIEVPLEEHNETKEGYASETSAEYKNMQAELIDKYSLLADIIICTALIPGKNAPRLLKESTLKRMKPGSIVVDLATSRGGNCELSKIDETVKCYGITIIGTAHMAQRVPTTASELYANNLYNLINLLTNNTAEIHFDKQDEIICQTLICYEGRYKPFIHAMEKSHG